MLRKKRIAILIISILIFSVLFNGSQVLSASEASLEWTSIPNPPQTLGNINPIYGNLTINDDTGSSETVTLIGGNSLKPELMLKQKMAKKRSEITTFKGIKGVRELLYELLEAGGGEHHTFGSSKDSLMMGASFWLSYHRKRSEKNIKAKLLFNESLRKWCDVNLYPKTEYKFTKTGFEPLTETIIRNDKIGIILWTETPIGILIHNKVAAESYDKFWEMMWKAN